MFSALAPDDFLGERQTGLGLGRMVALEVGMGSGNHSRAEGR